MPSNRQYSGISAAYVRNVSGSGSETFTRPTSISDISVIRGGTLSVTGFEDSGAERVVATGTGLLVVADDEAKGTAPEDGLGP